MAAASEYLPRLRQSLLLDWDDPIFSGPLFVGKGGAARTKLTRMVSPRSEDALTWSVFRTLLRLPAEAWLPPLLGPHRPQREAIEPFAMRFWPAVPPPAVLLQWLLEHPEALHSDRYSPEQVRGRLERVRAGTPRRGEDVFEGPSEPDVVIDTPAAVLVIEGKFTADIEAGTAWWPDRDQIARGLDAALELAGSGRAPHFLLLTDDYVHQHTETPRPLYELLMPRYRGDPAFLAERLPHRSPGDLARLRGCIHWLSWADLLDAVLDRSVRCDTDQKRLLMRLVDYLKVRRLLHRGG